MCLYLSLVQTTFCCKWPGGSAVVSLTRVFDMSEIILLHIKIIKLFFYSWLFGQGILSIIRSFVLSCIHSFVPYFA